MTTYSYITTVERLLHMDSTNQPHYNKFMGYSPYATKNCSLFNGMHTLPTLFRKRDKCYNTKNTMSLVGIEPLY